MNLLPSKSAQFRDKPMLSFENERPSLPSLVKRIRPSFLFALSLLHYGCISTTDALIVPTTAIVSRHKPFTIDVCLHAQAGSSSSSIPPELNHSHGRRKQSNKSPNGTKLGWRRRVFSRFRRKHGATESLMQAESTLEEKTKTLGIPQNLDQFVLENFERLSPEQLFKTLENTQYVLDDAIHHSHSLKEQQPLFDNPQELPIVTQVDNNATELSNLSTLQIEEDVVIKQAREVEQKAPPQEDDGFAGGPAHKMVRNWFQNLLASQFEAWAAEPPVNMQVKCSPQGNVFWSILQGQIDCNARVDFDRFVFNFIQLSSGSIEGSGLSLNLPAFTVNKSHLFELEKAALKKETSGEFNGSTTPVGSDQEPHEERSSSTVASRLWKEKLHDPRYRAQFDLYANDCILTQGDLFQSSCIKNGLQDLLVRVLKRQGFRTLSVEVTGISILKNGKISCQGEARIKGMLPKRVDFEVRSGIEFTHRGHVIGFPGLEISLSPEVGLFVPIIPTMELDIGHNARLRELTIDGERKQVKLAATVTITPKHTRKLSHEFVQPSKSYSSRFSVDFGRWLTRVGRFNL